MQFGSVVAARRPRWALGMARTYAEATASPRMERDRGASAMAGQDIQAGFWQGGRVWELCRVGMGRS